MSTCPACGSETVAGARFCPGCGRPVAGAESSAATEMPASAEQEAATAPLPEDGAEASVQPTAPLPSGDVAPRPSGASASPPGVTAAPADTAAGTRRMVTLLGVLSGILALALLAGGVLAYVELDRRADREATLRGQVASLTQANLDFQSQVETLTGERDRLASERDGLAAERDRLLARVDELEKTNAEQEKRIQELTGQLEEQGRQLSQAREEATRNQQLAEAATGVSVILAQVVAIDDEIHAEFGRFFEAVIEMQDAYYQRNSLAFESAARRADQSAQRLEQLFAQRDQLLAQLGY